MVVQIPTTSAAEQLAGFALELRYEDIPAAVVDAAKQHLLDAIGCGLAAHALDIGGAARRVALDMGGTPEATVIGSAARLPAPAAALANGTLMHALDFDDTHSGAIAHVSTVVAPAAMAVADACNADGRSFVTALVAGNEAVTRIGMAAVGEFHARGLHPTSIAGVFGATVAAATLVGSDRQTATSALGIAGSMASGLFAYLDAGTPTKPIHAGWAAQAGIVAARLAQAGAEGPATVFEGRFGLFDAFLGRIPDLDSEFHDLGSRWETLKIAYKPYPCCHFMHGALGAAASLGRIDPEAIADIHVAVPAGAVSLVLEPEDAKFAPRTTYDAKFSLQYSLASLIVHGSLGIGSYTPEAIRDPSVIALARRVSYEVREFPTYPQAFPGAVEIALRDGRRLDAELAHQEGGPENPLGPSMIADKFRENVAAALDDAAAAELERAVLAIDDVDDVAGVFARLASAAELPA